MGALQGTRRIILTKNKIEWVSTLGSQLEGHLGPIVIAIIELAVDVEPIGDAT